MYDDGNLQETHQTTEDGKMKTPEQIATETTVNILGADHPLGGHLSIHAEVFYQTVKRAAWDAIEADRAQRDEPEEVSGTEFQIGDVVRLTGSAWTEYGVQDQVVTVTRIDEDGDPETDTPEGFSIYDTTARGGEDCSATLVSRKGG